MVIQKPISVHHVFLHLKTIVGMPFKCSHCSYLSNRAKAFPTMVNDDRFDLSGLIETTTPKVRKSTAKKKSIGQHFFHHFVNLDQRQKTPQENQDIEPILYLLPFLIRVRVLLPTYFKLAPLPTMDWLLGRKSPPQNPPPQPPPPSQSPSMGLQDPQMFEAPDIGSILAAHDPASLHPLANLDKQTLDYIILEDEQIKSAGAIPSKGWADDLCYGTGTTYLTGTFYISKHSYPLCHVCLANG
jgi:hypothetical protein